MNETTNLPRYRTIRACMEEIRKIDRDTAVSEFFIRGLCRENLIAYHSSGCKYLVSLESLLEYLGAIKVPNPPKSKYFG